MSLLGIQDEYNLKNRYEICLMCRRNVAMQDDKNKTVVLEKEMMTACFN